MLTVKYLAPDNVTVAATSTRVMAENPERRFLQLVNISDENIFLAFGVQALQNKGLCLAANGVLTLTEGNMWLNSIWAICASGSKILTIQEAEHSVDFRS